MRQQEGIDDDHQLDVELDRGDHEEGYRRKERDDHQEGRHDHQEDLFSEGVTVTYSVTFGFAA